MPAAPSSPGGNRRSALLYAGGSCDLRCAVCDCATPASSTDAIEAALGGGGSRLVLRGAPEHASRTGEIIGRAREQGFTDIVLRSNAAWCASDAAAAELARLGADAVLVPLFSQLPAVHDRIAGTAGALANAVGGMRRLAETGLAVEIEVPLLAPRLQSLVKVIELARRAAPGLRSARFFLPTEVRHAVLAPASWDETAQPLADALLRCRALGVAARLGTDSAIPLCALRDYPDLYDAYAINPRGRSAVRGSATLGDVCSDCAVRRQCPGIARSYLEAHGENGLEAYDDKPTLMYEQRTTRKRQWTDAQRAAASRATLMVIRPTVNCNQDCTFCSANETSANVWSDHDEMLRAIARAARRGISWLSFSGGEPTLSKHLVDYIDCATRLGISRREIVSNAVLLDKPEKVRRLVDAGLTDAFISLHAHDESLSRQSTQKVGDFARTVTGIKNLLEAGVNTALNHVITARNYPYLEAYVEFVHRELGGRVKISFAFVTPQFKALDNIEVMPRLTDVMPYLKRAMYRAVELGQPFAVGSRQGIPFCFLDEFRAWSDGLKMANSAIAEDSPQKQRAAVCDECRFSDHCTGLWRPYVAKYGLDELRPVPGGKLTETELRALDWMSRLYPYGEPMSFDDVSEALRERELETGPPEIDRPAPAAAMPDFVEQRTRPLRVLMIGSGRQARRIASAAANLGGLSIDAVASPHAPQANLQDFGGCPAYANAADAIEDMRPEAAIIAAATDVHFELARLAIAHRIPTLLEKPITQTLEQAIALRDEAQAGDTLVVPAHNSLHAAGLEELCDGTPDRVRYLFRRTAQSPDSPRTWNRSSLYQTLYHIIAATRRAAGNGDGRVLRVAHRGEASPEQIRLDLAFGDSPAEIVVELRARTEEDLLATTVGGREAVWRRNGPEITISTNGTPHPVEARGNDIQAMLANFRDALLDKVSPVTNLDDAIDVMRTASAAIDALADDGAPFERRGAPKHVASRSLQPGA